MFMIFVFGTCARLPKPISFFYGNTKDLQIGHIIFGHLNMLEIWKFEDVGKDVCRKSWRSVLQFLETLEYGINIFQTTWNGVLVIWDHWFVGSLKILKIETLNLWNFWSLELRNFETKQPRHQETKIPRYQETKKPRNQEAVKLWNLSSHFN